MACIPPASPRSQQTFSKNVFSSARKFSHSCYWNVQGGRGWGAAARKQPTSPCTLRQPVQPEAVNTHLHGLLHLPHDQVLEGWLTEHVVRGDAGLTTVHELAPSDASGKSTSSCIRSQHLPPTLCCLPTMLTNVLVSLD